MCEAPFHPEQIIKFGIFNCAWKPGFLKCRHIYGMAKMLGITYISVKQI